MDEIKTHGPYPTSVPLQSIEELKKFEKMPLPSNQPNPYVAAFWKWWPELHRSLKVFRITGGEPLLSKDTFRILDYLLIHPSPDLELAINTNLCVPKKLIASFIQKLELLLTAKKIKQGLVFTSIDTWGKQAEYIRHGLNQEEYWENIENVLTSLRDVTLVFMCTYNALSVSKFSRLLEKVLLLKKKYGLDGNRDSSRVILDISFLKNPIFQSVKVLSDDYVDLTLSSLNFMKANRSDDELPHGYSDYEIEKLNRIYQWMRRPESLKWTHIQRADFFRFFEEHDRRRKTNFLETFPEMTEFWELCKKSARYSQLPAPQNSPSPPVS